MNRRKATNKCRSDKGKASPIEAFNRVIEYTTSTCTGTTGSRSSPRSPSTRSRSTSRPVAKRRPLTVYSQYSRCRTAIHVRLPETDSAQRTQPRQPPPARRRDPTRFTHGKKRSPPRTPPPRADRFLDSPIPHRCIRNSMRTPERHDRHPRHLSTVTLTLLGVFSLLIPCSLLIATHNSPTLFLFTMVLDRCQGRRAIEEA